VPGHVLSYLSYTPLVHVKIGPLSISPHGVGIAVGFLAGARLMLPEANRKGITDLVTFGDRELTDWEMYRLPFDKVPSLKFRAHSKPAAPAVHRGTFSLSELGDTFLDMRAWGKGVVFVNGHNLGRYWNIGPQQTLYLPGVWLKKGRNEIVVFEEVKDDLDSVAGLKSPILNELHRENITPARGPMKAPKLEAASMVQEGALASGRGPQEIRFPATRARYLCLQALSSHNGDEYTTLAELDALDVAGKTIPRKAWRVVYVDSEEDQSESATAENVFDGDSGSFWHSIWSAPHTSHPHTLVLDLGAERELSGVRLLPRQESENGRIKDYRLYLSLAPF